MTWKLKQRVRAITEDKWGVVGQDSLGRRDATENQRILAFCTFFTARNVLKQIEARNLRNRLWKLIKFTSARYTDHKRPNAYQNNSSEAPMLII